MKTSVQAFFTTTLAAIVLSTSAFATSTDSVSIQKVIVKGNAKVILIQKDQESVRIDGNSHDRTTINTKGKSLLITSNEAQPVTIIVYVKKPFRVEAFNTSTVETSGKFSVEFLQVGLKDQAKANINADTKGLYTLINDQSKLKLSGTSQEHISIRSKTSKLQMDNLASNKTSSTYLETANEKLTSTTPAGSKVAMSRR